MSAFEYVAVLLAIVIALGIARLLGGIADVIRLRCQLTSKTLYLWWCGFLLAVHIGWWFGVWHVLRPAAEFTLLAVFGNFSVPASLYVASRLLVPDVGSASAPSLERRLDEIRVPFLVCVAIPWLPGVISNLASGHTAAAGFLIVIGALALVGIPLSSKRWQLPLVILMSGVYLVFLVLFRTNISDFGP